MLEIKEAIIQKLAETEKCYTVKIPLAIESGSRGWGFASPDSDYDCRFVYVHERDWYLSVLDKKDIIEYVADAVFDVNGWDLKKVLQHIMKSNAVMFEWLSSNEIYIRDEYITGLLRGLAEEFFNPIAVSYHYLSIAKNKLAEILAEDENKLKRYFYVLRPIAILNFIYQYNKIPYMEYDRTLAETETAPDILDVIRELEEIKAVSNESHTIKQNKKLIDYFQREIGLFTDRLDEMKFEKNRGYARVDVVFKEIIERAWANEQQ